ncbi:MAG TPA: hypothetical protein PLH15_01915 [Spirochaetota bacterium]|nr:hypothetical protein [Spirochaetota bacterium]HQO21627.1 hypothetical protein [Spirochaetota bacterium]HQQ22580.1 hypothetical protein [Spirochaetota bacterium]
MKKNNMILSFLAVSLLFFFVSCRENDNLTMSRPVLIEAKQLSQNEYLIRCAGYPNDNLEGIQKEESAKEAALINAQMIAKGKFKSIDTVKLGEIRKNIFNGSEAEIFYVIVYPDIKKYLR